MQTTSEQYRKLLADPEHVRETRVTIAGVEYGQEDIFSCSTAGNLFGDVAAGGCVSRELDLAVRPRGAVPRMAEVALFTRLTAGEAASEWVPRGVFYVDTRSTDESSGLLTIHGFDGMLKAERVWWDPSEDAGEWPMSQKAAADEIARRMGSAVDPRTKLNEDYLVEYPNDLTMREVLSYIAACHVGNWAMTGEGKLLLLPVGGLPEETYFLVDGADGGAILFGEVRLRV